MGKENIKVSPEYKDTRQTNIRAMKIVDCFTFYNELDMLMYRLSILDPYIDHFVIVEATRTFRGSPKPLFYSENKEMFSRFAHKIVHIVEADLNANPVVKPSRNMDDDVWQNETKQRNSIHKGISALDLRSEDLLIISDVDEIPNPRVLQAIRANQRMFHIDFVALSQDMYYYDLTFVNKEKWFHAKLVSYDFYVNDLKCVPQKCRKMNASRCIENGGWHLSYFGDAAFIQNKIKEFSHQEWNAPQYTDLAEIQRRIYEKKDLFGRQYEQWVHLPIEQNRFLPPRIEGFPY